MTFKTTVKNAQGEPVAGAFVQANDEMTGGSFCRSTDGAGYADVAMTRAAIGDRVTLLVLADGYKPHVEGDALLITTTDQVLTITLTPSSFKRPSRPIAVPRGSLPPMPAGSFDRELPWTPPASRDFLRADAWGVPVPGLPFVPRGSSEHPERFLTYFDYKYSRVDLLRGLLEHAARGYTHWVRSWPDARDDGGQSMQQFVDDCLFIKRTIPYVHVKLASKDFDPRDQTAPQWMDRLSPILDALLAAQAADEFGVWEWDSFNVPGAPTRRVFTWIGQTAHAAGCSFWLHFLPEHTSWFADGDSRGRFGFWQDLGADVDGLDYQTQPTWTIGETQARLVDTLTQFSVSGHKLRFFEDQAALQFTHDHPDEDDANLRGYLACCTAGPACVWGYGNGARRPDGSPL